MKCLLCGRNHNRKKFCSNKCKDRYHNLHNPRGKFSHLNENNISADEKVAQIIESVEFEECEEGWDAHKDSY